MDHVIIVTLLVDLALEQQIMIVYLVTGDHIFMDQNVFNVINLVKRV